VPMRGLEEGTHIGKVDRILLDEGIAQADGAASLAFGSCRIPQFGPPGDDAARACSEGNISDFLGNTPA
jgi:hypothetical protein